MKGGFLLSKAERAAQTSAKGATKKKDAVLKPAPVKVNKVLVIGGDQVGKTILIKGMCLFFVVFCSLHLLFFF